MRLVTQSVPLVSLSLLVCHSLRQMRNSVKRTRTSAKTTRMAIWTWTFCKQRSRCSQRGSTMYILARSYKTNNFFSTYSHIDLLSLIFISASKTVGDPSQEEQERTGRIHWWFHRKDSGQQRRQPDVVGQHSTAAAATAVTAASGTSQHRVIRNIQSAQIYAHSYFRHGAVLQYVWLI